MSAAKPRDPIDVYLADMLHAVAADCYHSALALSLALPDICASIEYPSHVSVGERYRSWCDTWGKLLTLTGADCYALPCAYLHNGSEEFSGKSAQKALFERVELTVGQVDGPWVSKALPPGASGGKQAVRLPMEQLCADMATSVDAWRRKRQDDPRVAAGIDELLWMRPAR